ncbi:hypothetical protein AB3N59_14890 [Leptospira sp. WS92.C1]
MQTRKPIATRKLVSILFILCALSTFHCENSTQGAEQDLTSILLPSVIQNGMNLNLQSGDNVVPGDNVVLFSHQNDISGESFVSDSSSTQQSTSPFRYRGDSIDDGIPDRLVTPKHVKLFVCTIFAYKSPEFGGPAYGQESISNADVNLSILAPARGSETGTNSHSVCEIGNIPISLSHEQDTPVEFFDLKRLTEEHDRVGLVLGGATYGFSSQDVQDPTYRVLNITTNLALNAPFMTETLIDFALDTVSARIFPDTTSCAENFSFADEPDPILSEKKFEKLIWDPRPGNCLGNSWSVHIDKYAKAFDHDPNHVYNSGYINSPPANFKNTTFYPGKYLMKAESPERSPEGYAISVSRIRHPAKKLKFNVITKHALFWDSENDSKFNPVDDCSDRPNAGNAIVNIKDPSKRNLIVRPPFIYTTTVQ